MMNNYKLVPLQDIKDQKSVYFLLQNIGTCENDFKNEVCGMPYSSYTDWFDLMIQWSEGINLPKGYVPQTIYILYFGDVPIGIGKIRHSLTEASRKRGGNIGYAISKEYRGVGHGTQLMKMLIKAAVELGVCEKLATVEKNNYASKKAIEAAGGVLVNENDERWFYRL